MDNGNMLKELNLTPDELDRFTKAFNDDKFRDLLREYAQEISDPETRKTYEAEIKLLEEERGNSVEFLHPTPFKALKTSVGGEQKCYINICADEKIDQPEFKPALSGDGRRGQCWTLPHSLRRGIQIRDAKGDRSVTYDVIFHPDTLHIASKNKKFMDMVENTAIKGIQGTFNVILDENNVREMKIKYKGVPQPCVIRKPIPGNTAKKKPPEQADLAFLYPDATRPSESTPKINSSFQIQPQKPKEPTKPKYTVKYRSVVDLQDFRCSRDSAQSPRPKEIVITIDLPLLRSAGDASLEVKQKILLLESKQPAYKLELPLAYPVDEDNGKAKFNTQSRQLIVTLPIRPPHEAFDFRITPASPVSETKRVQENKEERGGAEEKGVKWENLQGEDTRTEEQEQEGIQMTATEQIKNSEGKKEKTDEQQNIRELEGKGLEAEEEEMRGEFPKNESHEDTLQEKKGGNKEEDGNFSAEEENTAANNQPKSEHQHVLASDEETEAKSNHAMEFTSKKAANIRQNNMGGVSISEEDMKSSQMFATDETNASSRRDLTAVPVELSENHTDGDSLPAQQICHTSEQDEKPPAAFLREIDADGNEMVIRDHSTSAGFVFQNTLMFELD